MNHGSALQRKRLGRLATATRLALRTVASVPAVGLAALAAGPAPARAVEGVAGSPQLAAATVRAMAMGGAVTSSVRGFGAVAANPAGLGMSDGPNFSLTLLPVGVVDGMDPISLGDIAVTQGRSVLVDTKEAWLEMVTAEGAQTGPIGGSVTWLALSARSFSFHLSTVAAADMNLLPGVMELALYGNAGRTGSPTDLAESGSWAQGWAVSTAGLAFGLPFATADGEAAVGATLKFSLGHAAGLMDGGEASASSSPLVVATEFPTIYTKRDEAGNAGSGFGLDVGFQYASTGGLKLGATVQNVFNTFAWDEDKLAYRSVAADLRDREFDTNFAPVAFSQAPAALRDRWDDLTFSPRVSAGAAYDVATKFTVSADVHRRFGGGMGLGPDFSAALGGEWRGLPELALRAGGALVSGGFEVGGGAVIQARGFNLSLAGGLRRADSSSAVVGMVGVSYGAN